MPAQHNLNPFLENFVEELRTFIREEVKQQLKQQGDQKQSDIPISRPVITPPSNKSSEETVVEEGLHIPLPTSPQLAPKAHDSLKNADDLLNSIALKRGILPKQK